MSPFSSRWHRVAALRPRLIASLQVRRQRVRGQTWILLADEVSARSVRLNRPAYAFAARLDGRRSVQRVWDELQAHDAQDAAHDDAPTQDEAIELLARLREAGLVEFDVAAAYATLLPHLDDQRPSSRRSGLLSWRVPLFNPTRLLARLARPTAGLATRAAFVAWLCALAALLVLALSHASALWAHAATWMSTPRYLLLGIVLYPPIKLLHELGHGLLARHHGVPVREAGITLMALCLPVPYVDVSASAALPRARDRLAIVGAGIMVELVVALLGLLLWLALDDGWARDIGFVAFVIGSVSTLLFNANPLQRFDGYHLLCDALDLTNLATRSRQWWLTALRRHALGARDDAPALPLARGEQPWLVAYAPLAWAYQCSVAIAIAWWLASVYWVLGLVALAWLVGQQLIRPLARIGTDLRRLAPREPASARRLARLAIAVTLALGVLPFVPLPQRVVAAGVIWPPDEAQLRAESDGVVRAIRQPDGAGVARGDVVIELDNPTLVAREAAQAARVDGLRHEAVQAQSGGGAGTSDARAELERAEAELARTRTRLAGLQIRAGRAGRLVLPNAADLPGSHVRQGTLLGQVQDGGGPVLRVAIEQDDATELRQRARTIEARLADGRRDSLPGTLLRDTYAASTRLPSAALGTRQGGPLQTDPADKEGLTSVRPIVLVDIGLPPATGDAPTGLRGWARIDQGHAPAVLQAARWLRRQWQRHVEAPPR